LLIGYLECIILRKLWENDLKACIEFREFALRYLVSYFGCSIDFYKKRKDFVVIFLNFIVGYIIIWDACAYFSYEEDQSKRHNHQHELGNGLGEQ
jgi:hypothetical protein